MFEILYAKLDPTDYLFNWFRNQRPNVTQISLLSVGTYKESVGSGQVYIDD